MNHPIRNTFDAFADEQSTSSSSNSSGNVVIDESPHLDGFNELSEQSSSSSNSSGNVVIDERVYGSAHLDGFNESDSSDDEDDMVRCAICFLKGDQSDKWRRLITLPCCGSNGREETSSTRFCSACMLHLAHAVRADDEYQHNILDELPIPNIVKLFYGENDCQTLTNRFIHCPRCKDICVVVILNPRREGNSDWTRPTNAKSISLRVPKFNERCQFVGKKVGIAVILLKIAFLHHRLIPLEGLLGGSTKKEHVLHLVQWGILKRVKSNADIYTMEAGDHNTLKRIFELYESQLIMLRPMIEDLMDGLHEAAIKQLKQYHLRNASQMTARSLHYYIWSTEGLLQTFGNQQFLSPCTEKDECWAIVLIVCIFSLAMVLVVLVVHFTNAPITRFVEYLINTLTSNVYGALVIQFTGYLMNLMIGLVLLCILSIPLIVVVGVAINGMKDAAEGVVWLSWFYLGRTKIGSNVGWRGINAKESNRIDATISGNYL